MDFYNIRVNVPKGKDEVPQLYPDWIVGRTTDLMVRGRAFYAVWDEARGLWSTDEYDVQRIVDKELYEENEHNGGGYSVKSMRDFSSGSWASFRKFLQNISDNSNQLDGNLVFANTEVKKEDYASHKLPYSLEEGSIDSWEELMSTLYSPEERDKIEWGIGSVVSGESKYLQKFFVLYGPAGSGKSTVLNIIDKMFEGYTAAFDAKALGGNNNAFATEVFKSNPLVAIQHDGDLSGIQDNTKLNSIISHEDMTMNEKYKPSYTARVNAMLFMGTNMPVKISDAKSGILRRLIDIHPTGRTIAPKRYEELMAKIKFEYGAIAHHCMTKFNQMGRSYYNAYRPIEMMLQTDVFYNYIESIFDILKRDDGIGLRQAYSLYKEWCAETGIDKIMPQYKFREELRNYFDEFHDRYKVDGVNVYSYYSGYKPMSQSTIVDTTPEHTLEFGEHPSIFDELYPDAPAQPAKPSGFPGRKWDKVETRLSDVDTSELHFVKVPKHHIVIDFDLVNEDGEKDLGINIHEAQKWPATYAELSKSGAGIHLHYIYSGDVTELASVYDVGIEIKTLLGDSSLRRKLTMCNTLEIAPLNGGLPIKEKPMLDPQGVKSEKALRELVERNLRKEIHPGTKSSIDFIHKILEDAYASELAYDLSDMKGQILSFAMSSSNQAQTAVKTVQSMKFASESDIPEIVADEEAPIVFYDVEVYPNLFVICWKAQGPDNKVVTMVNPSQAEVEELLSMKLVGFYNRNYDNHILYAAYLGRTPEQLFELSDKIINGNGPRNAHLFPEAYNLSYADILDFSSKKQGLKKFELELGIHHMEMNHPWDQPVPDDIIPQVVDYCINDVLATEAVFEDRKQDFVARQILAELSGLSVNQTTQKHTAKIIFGDNKKPQSSFVYTDLSEEFPGYKFEYAKNPENDQYVATSTYKGEVTGEGGYVYAEPGAYENVALLDIASMHPTTIQVLNLFGDEYTPRYVELMEARLAIKHGDYEKAGSMLGGKLAPYLGDKADADALSYALKIVINIVYGLTSAKFENQFRDNRNLDNIVAKRGSLYMIDLKEEVQKRGFTVVHVKTDSIKIENPDQEIIDFVFEHGAKYGYTFEHEATYDKFALVNDAVYIARKNVVVADGHDTAFEWTAVGKQFQHPYVYKKLFSGEELEFEDHCETKHVVQGIMHLDFNEDPENETLPLQHVGKTGSFVPVMVGGGNLWRIKEVDGEDKRYAVTGTKGHRWIEREMALEWAKDDRLQIDLSYFEKLEADAKAAIEEYVAFEEFVL